MKAIVWKVVVLILLAQVVVYAQPSELPSKRIRFDHLPERLGLTQNSINCMLQDRTGYLWIGTWSGLLRYDGYTTRVYRTDHGEGRIHSNKITALFQDTDGFLWVGTLMGGLFRYDATTDSFINFVHTDSLGSLSSNNVWCVQQDKTGRLWVGTDRGLNVYDQAKKTFRIFHGHWAKDSLSHSFITDLFLSSQGDLWIGTENGLNRLIQGSDGHISFEHFIYNGARPGENPYFHNYIYQIAELTHNGVTSIWVTTIKGLKRLSGGTYTNYALDNKPSSFSFFRSLCVVNGEQPFILVGSEMGLNFFDPASESFTRFFGNFDPDVNLSHNTVTRIMLDRGGVLWVGTKKGLNKLDSYSKDFELHLTSSFDKTNSIITGIRESQRGGYWVSTMGGGLYRYRDGRFERFRIITHEKDDFADFIQTLYTDSHGRLWVGTAGAGVFVFREADVDDATHSIRRFRQYSLLTEPKASASYIMSVAEDRAGNVWIGTWAGGLNRIMADGSIQAFEDPLLKHAPLVSLYVDHSGVLWVGSRGNGIFGVRETAGNLSIEHFVHDVGRPESLCNNFVNCIYEDHAGGLWVGTEGGLDFFDRRLHTFKTFGLEQGHNNVIVSLLEDAAGKLWLAHWDGLTVLDPADSQFVRNYDSHDRIQGGFFYNNVCIKDSRERLLFGGTNGFNIIHPAAVGQNPVLPAIAINEFRVFNQPVPRTAPGDKPFRLKHFENSLSFEFAALDYAAPDKLHYAYMLEGFDRDWNYTPASRRFANYTNLNEGNYTFKVKAANSDGVWNGQEYSMAIVISPPWWKTIWAVLLYVACGVAVLHFFRKLILMRSNFLHDIKLERVQRENLEKLNQAKLQFFTNVSHEFRTPLTLILGPAQSLLDSVEAGKPEREQLLSISTNAQRLLRLVSQLLDFRKAESGNLKLAVAEGNLVTFAREVLLSFEPMAAQLRVELSFQCTLPSLAVWFDRDQFEKILFNLLSNAFKHTPEGGRITVSVYEDKGAAAITVEDSGKGIRKEHLGQIFQSFFSYDSHKHHMGTGIGLALAKSLVDMHRGSIAVESEEDAFTRFTVRIPLGHAHFDASALLGSADEAEGIESYPPLEENMLFKAGSSHAIPAGVQGERPRLLVVEDNIEVRRYVRSVFEGMYTVMEAADGQAGILAAQEEMPDLIISDVMMPVLDGMALCREIKSNIKTSHIPVILLTARTSLLFKVEGLELGADDYISKPFHPKVLQLKVRNLIRARETMRRMFTDNEVLSLDPKRVTLTAADTLFVERALDSVERNMSNAEYSVEDLCRDVGMSRMQLYRKLKAVTGQSANEFIRTLRMKRAAQLLEQQELTISEVTYAVGFSDLQYFRECFKKQFGVTPSEYC